MLNVVTAEVMRAGSLGRQANYSTEQVTKWHKQYMKIFKTIIRIFLVRFSTECLCMSCFNFFCRTICVNSNKKRGNYFKKKIWSYPKGPPDGGIVLCCHWKDNAFQRCLRNFYICRDDRVRSPFSVSKNKTFGNSGWANTWLILKCWYFVFLQFWADLSHFQTFWKKLIFYIL